MGRAAMWGVPVPDDEAARRKALAVAMWDQKNFPPLYRFSMMDPETLLHGSFGSSSPVKTLYVFGRTDGRLHRPRLEVHTLERGSVEAAAPILWLSNFGSAAPEPANQTEPITVAVSGSIVNGSLLAATAEGWLVFVEAPDARLLVMGTEEAPSTALARAGRSAGTEAIRASQLRRGRDLTATRSGAPSEVFRRPGALCARP